MTLTFNSDKYSKLLVKYQPKLIKNEAENEAALEIVQELMHRSHRTPEEDAIYELLITLIEKFEQEFYHPGAASTPDSMLQFLMEQQQVKPEDLGEIFGSAEMVAEVIKGGQKISATQAKALGNFFKVDPSLFM